MCATGLFDANVFIRTCILTPKNFHLQNTLSRLNTFSSAIELPIHRWRSHRYFASNSIMATSSCLVAQVWHYYRLLPAIFPSREEGPTRQPICSSLPSVELISIHQDIPRVREPDPRQRQTCVADRRHMWSSYHHMFCIIGCGF